MLWYNSRLMLKRILAYVLFLEAVKALCSIGFTLLHASVYLYKCLHVVCLYSNIACLKHNHVHSQVHLDVRVYKALPYTATE